MNSLLTEPSMHGKICLITGGTSGIGKVTASVLARMGATVVFTARSTKKAADTLREIQAETENQNVGYLLANFEDLDQVRALVGEFQARYSRLDVLVNNAGTVYMRREVTRYGTEKTLLVNHFAPFLLTNLLMDSMLANGKARIINVSSSSHWSGRLDLNDLEFQHGYNVIRAYERSKLANLLFTNELARRLEGSNVTVNAVHPGRVGTNIWRIDIPVLGALLYLFMRFTSLSPQEGADTLIYLASSPELDGVTGAYFANRKAVYSSPQSQDRGLAGRFWTLSERLTGLSADT